MNLREIKSYNSVFVMGNEIFSESIDDSCWHFAWTTHVNLRDIFSILSNLSVEESFESFISHFDSRIISVEEFWWIDFDFQTAEEFLRRQHVGQLTQLEESNRMQIFITVETSDNCVLEIVENWICNSWIHRQNLRFQIVTLID